MTTLTSRLELPYPDPGDPVTNGDDTIKALAQRLDNVLRRFEINVTVAAGVGVANLVFGAPNYATPPTVVATCVALSPDTSTNIWVAMVDSLTVSGCRVVVRHYENTGLSGTVRTSLVVVGDSL